MKRIFPFLMITLSVFVLIFCLGLVNEHHKIKPAISSNSVVVLELFTSQGCSSCPPADRLLGSYTNKKDIAALSFHVDYWNKYGWKDPFSKHSFSERQQNYATASGSEQVYTPQVIINGQKEMVGSDEGKIDATIKEYQRENTSSHIILDDIKNDNNHATIIYSIKGKYDNSVINYALVKNKITTEIKAGENRGVKITNYNVVQNFTTLKTFKPKINTLIMEMPANSTKNDFSIIIFLQDIKSNKIYAAAKATL